MRLNIFVLGVALALLAGCSADVPLNPSFPLTMSRAKAAIGEMKREPKALARPVIVVDGYLAPGYGAFMLAQRIRKISGDGRVTTASFFFEDNFDACRRKLIAAVDHAFPTDDPERTTEVDVVAISMGGVVARYAAMEAEGQSPRPREERRLRIANLYTISSPHRGARMAEGPSLNKLQLEMRQGSDFMERLDDALWDADYRIYPYVRLGDAIVGAENAAPMGARAWWVANPPLELAHVFAAMDARIQADIFRRLRGERGYATEPRAGLPGE